MAPRRDCLSCGDFVCSNIDCSRCVVSQMSQFLKPVETLLCRRFVNKETEKWVITELFNNGFGWQLPFEVEI